MKFFVARLTYRDGEHSPPWSLFAEDMSAAIVQMKVDPDSDVVEITIRERPLTEVTFFRDDPVEKTGVEQHPGMIWFPSK